MRRRRLCLFSMAAALAATAVVGSTGAASAAPGDDEGSKASELAEAQFRVYLLTTTELEPSDVTCTLPPTPDPSGAMLCFALVNDRDTVAAIATLAAPGQYAFTPINKLDTTGEVSGSPTVATTAGTTTTEQTTAVGSSTALDAAIVASVDTAIGSIDQLSAVLRQRNPSITEVSGLTFDAPTGTLAISVTTDSTAQGDRDVAAFDVTDTIAYLWEAGTPFRQAGATVQPRLEVTVDGTLYSTPYDVMVDVADYTIGYADWLTIATTAQAPVRAPGRKAPDRTYHAARTADGAARAAAHLDTHAAPGNGSTGRAIGHQALGAVVAAASGLTVPVA
jgi:hypothetical protein